MSRNRKQSHPVVLSDDEERLVRLFRLLESSHSEALADIGMRAMGRFSVDPDILEYQNPTQELSRELSADEGRGQLAWRLMQCMRPLCREYVWLEMWPWGYIEEIFEYAWSDSLIEVLLGDSLRDRDHAECLQRAIRMVYEDRRPMVFGNIDLKNVSIKYLVTFIREWRGLVVKNLERKIGAEHFKSQMPDSSSTSA